MGRAWRIEYEGALCHLMSRGNDGQNIYLNDDDRNLFLETISERSERLSILEEKMINDKKVKNQFDKLNSQFGL
jgi:hypothetical protein